VSLLTQKVDAKIQSLFMTTTLVIIIFTVFIQVFLARVLGLPSLDDKTIISSWFYHCFESINYRMLGLSARREVFKAISKNNSLVYLLRFSTSSKTSSNV